MELGPGDRFSHYDVEELIGTGGMATVFRARDARLDRFVALKILKRVAADDSAVEHARVLREARAGAALAHPNAVSVFDVGVFDDQAFIAMELVEGTSLRSRLNETIPLALRVKWLTDIANVLAAAHSNGIVHRDVKPENVMIRSDGVVKVVDFGIARREAASGGREWTSGPALAAITEPHVISGTPRYMAPEQMRGEPLDGRADQFAWGVVAYELLYGKPPWNDTGSAVQHLAETLTRAPAPVDASHEAIGLLPIVLRALSLERGERFSTMDEVSQQLAAASAHERQTSTRLRLRFALIAAALLSVVAVVSWRLRTSREVAASTESVSSQSASPSQSSLPFALPASSKPEAVAAFSEGMRDWFVDSNIEPAMRAFERAVALDPEMAAAHLRLGIEYYYSRHPREARDAFARATAWRERLNEHDRALLRATSLYVESAPPNFEEIRRRLASALERFPDDAELLLVETALQYDTGDFEAFLRGGEHLIRIGAAPVEAHNFRGMALLQLGRFDEARAAFEKCLERAPATTCLSNIVDIDSRRGACDTLEADARRQIALAPTAWEGYRWLAQALAAEERAPEAVREALAQSWTKNETEREKRRPADEARLALWQGDFTTAIARAAELESVVGKELEIQEHAEAARLHVLAAMESGQLAEAAAAGARYVARKDAWLAPPWHDDIQLVEDPTALCLEAQLRAKTMNETAFAVARDHWFRHLTEWTPAKWRSQLWYYGYGATVRTEIEAKVALEARHAYEPLPAVRLLPADITLGRTLLAAGDPEAARQPLTSATKRCDALEDPVLHVQSFALLGHALERTGDRSGACFAYGHVLARWRNPKPRSVTVEEVRQRVSSLGCP